MLSNYLPLLTFLYNLRGEIPFFFLLVPTLMFENLLELVFFYQYQELCSISSIFMGVLQYLRIFDLILEQQLVWMDREFIDCYVFVQDSVDAYQPFSVFFNII